jgi:hypothetical protein
MYPDILRRFLRTATVLSLAAAASPSAASEIIETDCFEEIALGVDSLTRLYGSGGVLLVFDLDNTLLAMDDPLGTPQWFDWQDSLVTADSDSPLRACGDFGELLELQGLLFVLGGMHAAEEGLPDRIARWQEAGHTCLVLSSREPTFNDATLRELASAGYDFTSSQPDAEPSFRGLLLPYSQEDVSLSGLTAPEATAFGLAAPREVRYEAGVLSVAGQHKGAMLLILLAHCPRFYPAVVFVDDEAENVQRVHTALERRGLDVTAYRYVEEDDVVAAFDGEEKVDASDRLRMLDQTLEAVFPDPVIE